MSCYLSSKTSAWGGCSPDCVPCYQWKQILGSCQSFPAGRTESLRQQGCGQERQEDRRRGGCGNQLALQPACARWLKLPVAQEAWPFGVPLRTAASPATAMAKRDGPLPPAHTGSGLTARAVALLGAPGLCNSLRKPQTESTRDLGLWEVVGVGVQMH